MVPAAKAYDIMDPTGAGDAYRQDCSKALQ